MVDNRTYIHTVFERLDRAVTNPQWLNIYKDARAEISDSRI